MKALIIKEPYVDWILGGSKSWELRSSKTNFRGKIGLIKSGSGTIIGECELVDCIELNEDLFSKNKELHKASVNTLDEVGYNKTYAWVMKNPVRYDTPKKYDHPNGAIIWVSINDNKSLAEF